MHSRTYSSYVGKTLCMPFNSIQNARKREVITDAMIFTQNTSSLKSEIEDIGYCKVSMWACDDSKR